jgi:hypothetical protein
MNLKKVSVSLTTLGIGALVYAALMMKDTSEVPKMLNH